MTPGITALEYAQRRKSLADSLPPGSVAVLCSTDVKWRTGSVFHKFHQDPDFFYLTGWHYYSKHPHRPSNRTVKALMNPSHLQLLVRQLYISPSGVHLGS